MQFNKEMIDLVREIRKKVPSQEKPGIKLANPELLSHLVSLYATSTDTVLRLLIRELVTLAGQPWLQALKDKTTPEKRFSTKVYRGQTEIVPKPENNDTPIPKKPQRIYRGQVIG